jgi:DNA-binding phage protein/predicted NAD-dependent protein-ADP-ribosyltransferase YbiA (DUF1768 family)
MNENLRITEILYSQKKTLTELGNSMNVSRENLYKSLELNPTIATLTKVSEVLDVRLSELFNQRKSVFGFISIDDKLIGKSNKFIINDLLELKGILNKIIEKYSALSQISSYSITDNLLDVLKRKNLDLDFLSNSLGVIKQNLLKSLKGNPSLKTLSKIAETLDIELCDLIERNQGITIKGIIYLEGINFNIFSIHDIIRLKSVLKDYGKKIIADSDTIEKWINSVSIDVKDIAFNNPPIKMDDIVFDQFERYDSTKLNCWSFRNHFDTRNGIELNLGNMINDFPFTMLGHNFINSECAYIAGCYTNQGEEYESIQKELTTFSNGLLAKRKFRKSDNVFTRLIRKDWNSFNTAWMLLVVWEKCKHSKEFRDLLLSIPDNATIIENSTKQSNGPTKLVWGCENYELMNLRSQKSLQIEEKLRNEGVTIKKTINHSMMIVENSINNIGVWEGRNLMGKILMCCKIALREKSVPPIDYDLLNRSEIYWFGEKLKF